MYRTFSLVSGGPFYRLCARLHLVDREGHLRAWRIALIAWAPFAAGELLRPLFHRSFDAIAFDISVHVKLLVALPVMLISARLVEGACRGALAMLAETGICDQNALDPIVARAERMRDWRWLELGLAVLAITGGQLALWHVVGAGGYFHGGTSLGPASLPQIWYAAVALPLEQFVLARWLWHWMLWCWMLIKIVRLSLRPIATHPDRAAGLGCLAWPVTAFGPFAFAIASVMSAAWGTQMLAHLTTVERELPTLVGYIAIMLGIAAGPLLLYTGHLYRARRKALYEYSELAHDYVTQFQAKWIDNPPKTEHLLGTQDIQALNDLGGAFRVIEETRLIVFSPRRLLDVVIASVLPVIPLFANALSVQEVLKRIVFALIPV